MTWPRVDDAQAEHDVARPMLDCGIANDLLAVDGQRTSGDVGMSTNRIECSEDLCCQLSVSETKMLLYSARAALVSDLFFGPKMMALEDHKGTQEHRLCNLSAKLSRSLRVAHA